MQKRNGRESGTAGKNAGRLGKKGAGQGKAE
jgi:hypothetical protein